MQSFPARAAPGASSSERGPLAAPWGARAAADIRGQTGAKRIPESEVPPWEEAGLTYEVDPALIQGDNQNIRNLMWHYVGLIRNPYRLNRALRELRKQQVEEVYSFGGMTRWS